MGMYLVLIISLYSYYFLGFPCLGFPVKSLYSRVGSTAPNISTGGITEKATILLHRVLLARASGSFPI